MAALLPLLDQVVPAGFPAPADTRSSTRIDLNQHLVGQADATFLVRVEGDSMTGFGIYDGDTLVVDRSVTPQDGHIVLAVTDAEFTLKQLRRIEDRLYLCAGNPAYPNRLIRDEETLSVWGVARWSLHPLTDTVNP